MDEAERRYLTEIADDCRGVLGPGSTVLGIERDDIDAQIRLVARFKLDGGTWQSAATGDTVVDAHARLRARLLFDRIRIGFTTLVETH